MPWRAVRGKSTPQCFTKGDPFRFLGPVLYRLFLQSAFFLRQPGSFAFHRSTPFRTASLSYFNHTPALQRATISLGKSPLGELRAPPLSHRLAVPYLVRLSLFGSGLSGLGDSSRKIALSRRHKCTYTACIILAEPGEPLASNLSWKLRSTLHGGSQ
jgi:hypothetical protein